MINTTSPGPFVPRLVLRTCSVKEPLRRLPCPFARTPCHKWLSHIRLSEVTPVSLTCQLRGIPSPGSTLRSSSLRPSLRMCSQTISFWRICLSSSMIIIPSVRLCTTHKRMHKSSSVSVFMSVRAMKHPMTSIRSTSSHSILCLQNPLSPLFLPLRMTLNWGLASISFETPLMVLILPFLTYIINTLTAAMYALLPLSYPKSFKHLSMLIKF